MPSFIGKNIIYIYILMSRDFWYYFFEYKSLEKKSYTHTMKTIISHEKLMYTKILLIYFLFINVVTFLIRGIDKRKAKHQKRRIKEKTLLWFSLAWGFLGAFLAMSIFHHKTIKGKFLIRFYLIVVLRMGGIVFYLWNFA